MTTCYCESCPEAVPTINITQNTIAVDGTTSNFYNDYFLGSDVVANQLTLSHTPAVAHAVQMSVNGVVQGENTTGVQKNFSIAANIVTLLFVPNAADSIHFWYLGVV